MGPAPVTAESCQKGYRCTTEGRCAEKDGYCVPTAHDCQESLACSQEGRCTEKDGWCVK